MKTHLGKILKNKTSEVYTQILNRSHVPGGVQKRIFAYANTHKITPLLRQLLLLENVDPEIEKELKNSNFSNVQSVWAGRKERTSQELLELVRTKPKTAVLDAIASRADLTPGIIEEIFTTRNLNAEVALKLLLNPIVKPSEQQLEIVAKRAAKANMETLEGLLHKTVRAYPQLVPLMVDAVNSKVAHSLSRWGDYGREVNLKLLSKVLETAPNLPHDELTHHSERAAFKNLISEIVQSDNVYEKLTRMGLPVFTDRNKHRRNEFTQALEKKITVEEYKQQILNDPSTINGVDFMFYPGLTAKDALEILQTARRGRLYWNWSAELFTLRFPEETQKNVEVMLKTAMIEHKVEMLVRRLKHPAETVELLIDTIVKEHLKATGTPTHKETLLELLASPFFSPETILKCPLLVLTDRRLPAEALTFFSQTLEEKFEGDPGRWEIFESFFNDERNAYHPIGFILEMIENL